MSGYRYQSQGRQPLTAHDIAILARRNGVEPALATSREARAAVPTPDEPPVKGGVKVEGFPEKESRYPFRQIADDGGVWRLDPAAFGVQAVTLRSAASKWAIYHGAKAKTVLADDGLVYIQITKREAS